MHMIFKRYGLPSSSVWARVARCTCQEPGTDMFNDIFNDQHPLAASLLKMTWSFAIMASLLGKLQLCNGCNGEMWLETSWNTTHGPTFLTVSLGPTYPTVSNMKMQMWHAPYALLWPVRVISTQCSAGVWGSWIALDFGGQSLTSPTSSVYPCGHLDGM